MSATDDARATAWATAVMNRLADLGLTTDAKIGAAGGPSTSTLTAYRALAEGRKRGMTEPRDDTFGKVDFVCRWVPGSARRFWRDGIEPAALDGSPQRPVATIPSTDEGLMEFEVSGDFGVRVIVKGPVSNARELEQSVSRLIQDIRRSDEERDARSHG